MKTVRFPKVVQKCGKPEVYLLMTETDPDFHKALHADKIMSLSDDSHGAVTEYGTVGYDKKRKGQILLFPKTFKSFEDTKVVGIKYDLFAEEKTDEPTPEKRTKPKEHPKNAKARLATKPVSRTSKKAEKAPTAEVIHFPKSEKDDEEEDESVTELKGCARQAMRALEKNNSVAAYNLLKRMIGE
jgi:hypothetical protein